MGNSDYTVKYVRAFKDNYIWLIINRELNRCIVIDPGDSIPVIKFLSDNKLELESVWITHHHADHCGGIHDLKEKYAVKIYGPKNESIPEIDIALDENDSITPSFTNEPFKILSIPGHTKDHIAFYSSKELFCGDTLFSSGCGKLFEGTAEQMYASLKKIRSLLETTFIFCAHEYTLNNLNFSMTVDPNNIEIPITIEKIKPLLNAGHPSIPTTLAHEKKINPFLRCHMNEIAQSVEKHFNQKFNNEIEVFRQLRLWKDSF